MSNWLSTNGCQVKKRKLTWIKYNLPELSIFYKWPVHHTNVNLFVPWESTFFLKHIIEHSESHLWTEKSLEQSFGLGFYGNNTFHNWFWQDNFFYPDMTRNVAYNDPDMDQTKPRFKRFNLYFLSHLYQLSVKRSGLILGCQQKLGAYKRYYVLLIAWP